MVSLGKIYIDELEKKKSKFIFARKMEENHIFKVILAKKIKEHIKKIKKEFPKN